MRMLCATLPADWWDTSDDGARLALALCSVCPGLSMCDRGREYGVIRAGIAWNDHGARAGICGCGYPLPAHVTTGERPQCYRCEPRHNLTVPGRRPRRRRSAAC